MPRFRLPLAAQIGRYHGHFLLIVNEILIFLGSWESCISLYTVLFLLARFYFSICTFFNYTWTPWEIVAIVSTSHRQQQIIVTYPGIPIFVLFCRLYSWRSLWRLKKNADCWGRQLRLNSRYQGQASRNGALKRHLKGACRLQHRFKFDHQPYSRRRDAYILVKFISAGKTRRANF